MKQAAEFGLTRPGGPRVVPMQLMIDEIKAIGLQLGQGNYAHGFLPETIGRSQGLVASFL
jgi:hypothetical protein